MTLKTHMFFSTPVSFNLRLYFISANKPQEELANDFGLDDINRDGAL